jgi:arsenate reductase-like glutaredoxin family protein
MTMTDPEIVERLLTDPGLLRVPLVRHENQVTAGKAEATWAEWLRRPARNVATR